MMSIIISYAGRSSVDLLSVSRRSISLAPYFGAKRRTNLRNLLNISWCTRGVFKEQHLVTNSMLLVKYHSALHIQFIGTPPISTSLGTSLRS